MTDKSTIRILGVDTNLISDGFHTFGELYAHRIELWIALCRVMNRHEQAAWRSRLHSDGSAFDGWFVLGWRSEFGGQITYHLPSDRWEDCGFAETLDRAPEWDGHSSDDVLARIRSL